ncbi:thermonuclease family protein [Amnibacterium kyonggiense]|uniref:Endonuclease YncB(Thermonuclease family) n=1 Tax=Amnibacterium kyonggiense TaxID=595671 RepID=A0A4R7FP38_9MICO|nr:nuclease [Amnibacterium kyonggiense]TDS79495.1 endonuclease YncB(thermonuclease family) [Amnibacterium kyonggiense]
MGEATYRVITGQAVLVGKQPDGDSVRFVPDDPSLLRALENGDRVRISADGSVQLRFDGIDAPELHYQGAAQPLGATARDQLLRRLGFDDVAFAADGETVASASPTMVRMTVLSRLVEVNGRPVSVVFAGADADEARLGEGPEVDLTPTLLERSVNHWEVSEGVAYPLLYTSTTGELRDTIRAAARGAREERRGVWSLDSTSSFSVADVSAVDEGGTLIWPKLFRRVVDYLRQRGAGQSLADWLIATPLQDDEIFVTLDTATASPVPLHTLLAQTDDQVEFRVDLLDLTVVER